MASNIRITSGTFGGRKIATPGAGTHPMGERERLALFNMISMYLPDALLLDAFAGSGALGIEALSRGAGGVVFVEANRGAVKCIQENLELLGIHWRDNEKIEVINSKVQDFTTERKFDIILADPPYDAFRLSEIEHLITTLKTGGILVLSHPGEIPTLPKLKLQKSRKYAGASISIYQEE